jgi:hypothetical protein
LLLYQRSPGASFLSRLGIPLCVLLVIAVVWAIRKDLNTWKTRPSSELVTMVEGNDWSHWQNALAELQRRDEDLSRFIPLLISRLVSDSPMARSAADATLKKSFPEFKEHPKGYLSAQDPAVSRRKIAPLLAKHGL